MPAAPTDRNRETMPRAWPARAKKRWAGRGRMRLVEKGPQVPANAASDEDPQDTIRRLERRIAELETARARTAQDREELFTLAMRGPNEGLWDWNPVTKELFLSARLLSILGFEGDTLRTSSHEWLKLVHPDDRAHYEATVAEHLKGVTDHFECEYRVADRAGNFRWMLARGLAQRGPDGIANRMVGSIGDITELKRRETVLRDSEARFRSLIRTAGSIILVLGEDGTIQEANREAERAFGLEPGTAAGRSWRTVIGEQRGGPFAFQLVAAMTGHEIRNFEQSLPDPAGGERVLLWNMNRLPPAEGGTPAIICVGQDITRRKRAELALRQAHDELEARVEERTRALMQEIQERRRAEEALLHAKEQAELANRAKSDFLANMSHELRTPLNAIIGFSSMMESEIIGPLGHPKYREYATVIGESGQHLLAVINDILDVAKIEAGKLEVHPQPMNVREAVDSSVMLIGERAGEGRITLVTDIAEDTPLLLGDPTRVKQILLNLLSNAVKFTPAGGTVTLRVQPDAEGVRIEVSDTGIGMSAEGIRVALTPFGQVDSQLTRRAGGTGLGLPLVRSFVDMLGGSMGIESREGEGTTVRIVLPRATDSDVE